MDRPDVIAEVQAIISKLAGLQSQLSTLVTLVSNLNDELLLAEMGQGTLFEEAPK